MLRPLGVGRVTSIYANFNIGTKESVYIRKEFNSYRIGSGHLYGRPFIVWEHEYGRLDVM